MSSGIILIKHPIMNKNNIFLCIFKFKLSHLIEM